MAKRKTIILLVILIIGCGGILYAVKEYNRKPAGVENSKPAYTLTAHEFIREYSTLQEAANHKYLGQTIIVHGRVNAIDRSNPNHVAIVLGESGSSSGIRCNMDSTSLNSTATIKEQDSIAIKGICTGYIPDDMGLGADIILTKSIISTNN
jgi:hypothetical protein